MQLKDGLSTKIGEKGINISGGQKARISLARALYSDSDIYLLDDPLSALDQKVGQEIYTKCIREYLKEKCVILTTHQVHLLEDAHKIIVMKDGQITEIGDYDRINQKEKEYKHDLDNENIDEFGSSVSQNSISVMIDDLKPRLKAINSTSISEQDDRYLARAYINQNQGSKLIDIQKYKDTMNHDIDSIQEYVDRPVRMKDWFKLFSFGIGNKCFAILVLV